jgi:hypothetical protein
MNSPRWSLLSLTALACAVAAQAQTTTGGVRGAVKSRKGGVVAGASLVIRNLETGFTRTQMTDSKGGYSFSLLPVGRYELTVTAHGLKTAKDGNVRVILGQASLQNFTLDSAEAAAVVEVVSDSAVVDSTQINTATSITSEFVEAIPVKDRNFTDLVLMTPGAAENAEGYRQTVEGARGVQNNLQIDGASFNSKFNGEQRGGTRIPFSFSQDTIKELQVITNSFDAQYGDAAGAVINAVSKTGTNDLSGTAFMQWRPSAFVANIRPVPYDQYGTTNRPKALERDFSLVQAGMTLGGPIIKDKLHYYVGFEYYRFSQNNVPAASDNVSSSTDMAEYNTFFGLNGQPTATAMGRTIRTSNSGKTMYQESQTAWDNTLRNLTFFARLDWSINADHRAALRMNLQDYHGENDTYSRSRRSNIAESNNTANDYSSISWVAELNSVFGPNLVNEARVQVATERRPTTPNSTSSAEIRVGGINYGQSYLDPRNTKETDIQVQDNLTFFSGDWTFKGGFDVQFLNYRNLFYQNRAGSIQFAGYGVANRWYAGTLQSGDKITYYQNYSPLGGISDFDETFLAGYVQAQYAGLLNRRLTLSAGARYSREQWDSNDSANPRLQGLDQMPDSYALDPRFAFTWDLFGTSRTVIRGGHGRFSSSNPAQTASGALMNNGINVLPYKVISTTGSYMSLFQAGGLLSPDNMISGDRLHGLSQSQLGNLPLGTLSLTLVDPEARMAQARATSLAFEQDLGRGFQLVVRGAYKEFRNLQYFVNINLGQYAAATGGSVDSTAFYDDGYRYTTNRFSTSNRPGRARVRGRWLDLTGYGDVGLSKYDGEGKYRAAVVELNRRADNGWGFRSSVTFSKSEDNNTNERSTAQTITGNTAYPATPLKDWGLSDNDHKFRGVLAWYSPTWAGFRLSGFASYTTGRPYTAVYYDDMNGDGLYNDPVNDVRNGYRQPHQKTCDLRLGYNWKFPFMRSVRWESTVEVINLFNWANQYTSLKSYAKNPTSAKYDNFGLINAIDSRTREAQLSLKARW